MDHLCFADVVAFQACQQAEQLSLIERGLITSQCVDVFLIIQVRVESITLAELSLDLLVIVHHYGRAMRGAATEVGHTCHMFQRAAAPVRPADVPLEKLDVPPRKGDIDVDEVLLVWMPRGSA